MGMFDRAEYQALCGRGIRLLVEVPVRDDLASIEADQPEFARIRHLCLAFTESAGTLQGGDWRFDMPPGTDMIGEIPSKSDAEAFVEWLNSGDQRFGTVVTVQDSRHGDGTIVVIKPSPDVDKLNPFVTDPEQEHEKAESAQCSQCGRSYRVRAFGDCLSDEGWIVVPDEDGEDEYLAVICPYCRASTERDNRQFLRFRCSYCGRLPTHRSIPELLIRGWMLSDDGRVMLCRNCLARGRRAI